MLGGSFIPPNFYAKIKDPTLSSEVLNLFDYENF